MGKSIELKFKNFELFLQEFRPELQSIFHLAITTRNYFHFAKMQADIFNEKINVMYDRSDEKNFSSILYSSCFATYVHIRTCLESNKRLSDELQNLSTNTELQEFRAEHSREIHSIINIANNIVKHPLDKDGKVCFYEPGGFNNSGEVTIHEWSTVDENYFELPKIKPINDLQSVFNYLEDIAEIYLKIVRVPNSEITV